MAASEKFTRATDSSSELTDAEKGGAAAGGCLAAILAIIIICFICCNTRCRRCHKAWCCKNTCTITFPHGGFPKCFTWKVNCRPQTVPDVANGNTGHDQNNGIETGITTPLKVTNENNTTIQPLNQKPYGTPLPPVIMQINSKEPLPDIQ